MSEIKTLKCQNQTCWLDDNQGQTQAFTRGAWLATQKLAWENQTQDQVELRWQLNHWQNYPSVLDQVSDFGLRARTGDGDWEILGEHLTWGQLRDRSFSWVLSPEATGELLMTWAHRPVDYFQALKLEGTQLDYQWYFNARSLAPPTPVLTPTPSPTPTPILDPDATSPGVLIPEATGSAQPSEATGAAWMVPPLEIPEASQPAAIDPTHIQEPVSSETSESATIVVDPLAIPTDASESATPINASSEMSASISKSSHGQHNGNNQPGDSNSDSDSSSPASSQSETSQADKLEIVEAAPKQSPSILSWVRQQPRAQTNLHFKEAGVSGQVHTASMAAQISTHSWSQKESSAAAGNQPQVLGAITYAVNPWWYLWWALFCLWLAAVIAWWRRRDAET